MVKTVPIVEPCLLLIFNIYFYICVACTPISLLYFRITFKQFLIFPGILNKIPEKSKYFQEIFLQDFNKFSHFDFINFLFDFYYRLFQKSEINYGCFIDI